MSDLNLNSIMSLLSGSGTSAISKRTKVKENDVSNVLSAAVPILLTGMKRNAGTKSGEDSLRGALSDHAAADLSDPGAFLKSADLKDGKKILGHVLGSDQNAIIERVSAASGVTKGKTTSILAMIAPLLLSLLGGQQNQQQSQQGSGFNLLGMLGGLLGGGSQEESEPETESQSGGGLLDSLGGLGGLTSLFGGSSQSSSQSSGGILSSIFSIFKR